MRHQERLAGYEIKGRHLTYSMTISISTDPFEMSYLLLTYPNWQLPSSAELTLETRIKNIQSIVNQTSLML